MSSYIINEKRILELISILDKNKSLTQCTTGTNETESDIEKIEKVMDRNYQLK